MAEHEPFTGKTWREEVKHLDRQAHKLGEDVFAFITICTCAMRTAVKARYLEARVNITNMDMSVVDAVRKHFDSLVYPIQSRITEETETDVSKKHGVTETKVKYLDLAPSGH